MALRTGDVIDGKYRVVRAIGEGGMGAVYEAEHGRIHRRVAIKVLHPAIASDQNSVVRFEREAQAAGRIGNDHIIEVLDIGNLPDGSRFMVMEFLDGEPLTQRIRRFGRLTAQAITPLARQILVALDAAHAAGIVHRDLKPDNVFVLHAKAGNKDFVKLIDFGISKFQVASGDKLGMTKVGSVMGTPYYMSPEQAAGTTELDRRTDLYAVGVILYEAVTGSVPFHADSLNQLIIKIALTEPPPVTTLVPDLEPAFAQIITRAMARDPSQRYQSAGEFIGDLDSWFAPGRTVSMAPSTTPYKSGEIPAFAAATLMTPIEVSAPRSNLTPRPDAYSQPPVAPVAHAVSQGGQWAASQNGNWAASHHGSWAASQQVEAPGAHSRKGAVFVFGALAGAGLLAALALGVYHYKSRGAAAAQAAALGGAPEPASVPAVPPSVVVSPVIDPAPAPPASAPVEPAVAAKSAPGPQAASPKSGAPTKEAEPPPAAAPAAPPPEAPAATPSPAAPPPAAPAAEPKPPVSDLDHR